MTRLRTSAVRDGIAHLFLVADHVAKQRHLLDFLEAALPDRLVRRLRRHQQHRRVIPVGGLDGGHEIRDARAILRNRHAHLAGRARIAVADEAAIGLVRNVPECDAGLGKQIGDRHERRTDDAEGVLDAVHLQHLHEGFFCRHLHRSILYPTKTLLNADMWFRSCPERFPQALTRHCAARADAGARFARSCALPAPGSQARRAFRRSSR